MTYFHLGSALKLLLLSVSALALTGCYKIEIIETLNLDGTSKMSIKMDMSQMVNMVGGMAEGMAQGMAQGFEQGVVQGFDAPLEASGFPQDFDLASQTDFETGFRPLPGADSDTAMVVSNFTGCTDPVLLNMHDVETLAEPQTFTETEVSYTSTTCQPGRDEGTVEIVAEAYTSQQELPVDTQRIIENATGCSDPELLDEYQVENFDEAIIEDTSTEFTTTLSCSETDKEITITTTSADSLADTDETFSETFPKGSGAPASFEDFTSQMSQDFDLEEMGSFCEDSEQKPEDLPFFFEGCEDIAPGVGAFHFTKFDTSGFVINSNGTVTYNLDDSTNPIMGEMDAGLQEQQGSDEQAMPEMDPAMFGLVMDYVLISPWPILEHNSGTKEDDNTLRINLLKEADISPSVTLDTDGATLKIITPDVRNQINGLVERLAEKLEASEAPVERKQEYVIMLIEKIQKLAEARPEQQVALGYLQNRLSLLVEELAMQLIDFDLLSELDALESGVWEEVEAAEEGLDEEPEPFNKPVDEENTIETQEGTLTPVEESEEDHDESENTVDDEGAIVEEEGDTGENSDEDGEGEAEESDEEDQVDEAEDDDLASPDEEEGV